MLLTIDVGNSNTMLGVFRGEELTAHWRLTTARQQTVDEYGVLTRNLLGYAGIDPKEIGGVIVSSVVPPVNWTLGVDKDGRPIPNPAKEPAPDGRLIAPDESGMTRYLARRSTVSAVVPVTRAAKRAGKGVRRSGRLRMTRTKR